MSVIAQAFLGGFCGFMWVLGFLFGVVAVIGVIGILFTILGFLLGGESKNEQQKG